MIKILAVAGWIGIWFLMAPTARRKGASPLKWYLYGISAYILPFAGITYGPLFLSVLVDTPEDRSWFSFAYNNIVLFAVIGFCTGFTLLVIVYRKLKQLPNKPWATFGS